MSGTGSSLPAVANRAELIAADREPAIWLPTVHMICEQLDIPATALRRMSEGSNIVFGAGETSIIKLFPPFWADLATTERLVAEAVFGQLSIPTPAIRGSGDIDGWSYLAMDRLAGTELNDVWRDLPVADQLTIASELGVVLAELHALPTSTLAGLGAKWAAFVHARREQTVGHHRARGVGEQWLTQMQAFLDHLPPVDPTPPRPVLLNTDLHQYHLMAEERSDGWHLSGMFDFDDAMVGVAEYDLASPGLIMMAGRPHLLRVFCHAYGYGSTDMNSALSERLLGYTLMHRYRDFAWITGKILPNHGTTTLTNLAHAIYPFSA